MTDEFLVPNGNDGGWDTSDHLDIDNGGIAVGSPGTLDDGTLVNETSDDIALVLDLLNSGILDADTVNSVTVVVRARTTGGGSDKIKIDWVIGGTPQGAQFITGNLTGSFLNYTAADAGWNSDWTAAELDGAQVQLQTHQTGKSEALGVEVSEVEVLIDYTEAGQTITIGLNTETDLAQAITIDPQHRLVNLITETDLAQPITIDPQHRFLGLVTETDLAQPITIDPQHRLLGLVTETDLAQPITLELRRLVNLVTETDLAQVITVDAGQTIAIGLNTEIDLAQPITVLKTRAIGLTTEIDLAQAITADKARIIGLNTETDLAQVISIGKARAIGLNTETDLAQVIIPSLAGGIIPQAMHYRRMMSR